MITAGGDIGSPTAKTGGLKDKEISGYWVCAGGSDVTAAASRVLASALEKAGCRLDDLAGLVATGYGRAKVPGAGKSITEITCDARGAKFLFPEAGRSEERR